MSPGLCGSAVAIATSATALSNSACVFKETVLAKLAGGLAGAHNQHRVVRSRLPRELDIVRGEIPRVETWVA